MTYMTSNHSFSKLYTCIWENLKIHLYQKAFSPKINAVLCSNQEQMVCQNTNNYMYMYVQCTSNLFSSNNGASPFPQVRERTWVERTCTCGRCTVSYNQTLLLSSWNLEKKKKDFCCNVLHVFDWLNFF